MTLCCQGQQPLREGVTLLLTAGPAALVCFYLAQQLPFCGQRSKDGHSEVLVAVATLLPRAGLPGESRGMEWALGRGPGAAGTLQLWDRQ